MGVILDRLRGLSVRPCAWVTEYRVWGMMNAMAIYEVLHTVCMRDLTV